MSIERLKKRREFLRVSRTGARWVERGLVLQAAPRGSDLPEECARIGFTVTKKVGNAVERNRARRRLKAAAAEVMPQFARPAIDYVVIGRHTTLSRPYARLVDDLKTAVSRIKIRDSK